MTTTTTCPASVMLVVRSDFDFSGKSVAEMKGVRTELVVCAWLALKLSRVDFSFYDGLRTRAEQLRNVATGASRKEGRSKHEDGDAADLVPWIGGRPTWEEKPCLTVAEAMRAAAQYYGFRSIRWGGVWDRTLLELGDDLEREVKRYRERFLKKNADRKPFFDGVHFEF